MKEISQPQNEPFGEPLAVAALLRKFPRPWFIAGGWAIDLFMNRVTRHHEDLEIAIFRKDQLRLRTHLSGWRFERVIPGRGGVARPWAEDEWLDPPIHEVHARRSTGYPKDLEILLNETTGNLWQYRRDQRVTRGLSEIGLQSRMGIPFLRPEIVLLYKARNPRGRDGDDFRQASRMLGDDSRAWLRSALEVCHPGHPWLPLL